MMILWSMINASLQELYFLIYKTLAALDISFFSIDTLNFLPFLMWFIKLNIVSISSSDNYTNWIVIYSELKTWID